MQRATSFRRRPIGLSRLVRGQEHGQRLKIDVDEPLESTHPPPLQTTVRERPQVPQNVRCTTSCVSGGRV